MKLPKEFVAMGKIVNSNEKLSKMKWIKFISGYYSTTGRRIVDDFIQRGILTWSGEYATQNNGQSIMLYKINKKNLQKYARQTEFYKFLLQSGNYQKIFGLLVIDKYI